MADFEIIHAKRRSRSFDNYLPLCTRQRLINVYSFRVRPPRLRVSRFLFRRLYPFKTLHITITFVKTPTHDPAKPKVCLVFTTAVVVASVTVKNDKNVFKSTVEGKGKRKGKLPTSGTRV